MDKLRNKLLGFVFIFLMYAVAIGAGVLTYWLLSFISFSYGTGSFSLKNLLLILIADIVATAVIWVFSLIAKNSSVYDPYWSVIPVFIVAAFIYLRGTVLSAVDIIIFFTVFIWAVRLTYNWARGWKGFKHEDWRYRKFRKQYPEFWHLINFFGIQLFPTLAVFAGLMPVYFAVNQPSGYFETVFAIIGATICIVATVLELVADGQMRRFRSNPNNKGKCIESGLWSISRHPNYVGEVLFWFGLFVTSIPGFGTFTFFGPDNFVLALLGFIIILLMFLFISIPLMEKHILRKRPQYAEYQKKVAKFIPWRVSQIKNAVKKSRTVSAPTVVLNTGMSENSAGQTSADDTQTLQ